MIAVIPALFVAIGLIMYFACTNNAKLAEIGRIMFAFAFLVLMLHAATKVVRLF